MVVPKLPSTFEMTVTVLLASAVPVKVGVESLVTSSVLESPRSLLASRSGAPGAEGAEVSTVTDRLEDADELFPAVSVAVAVMVWLPSLIALPGVKLQLPEPSAVVLPILPSTLELIATVLFASAVPVKVGVASLVMLSVLELPVSLPADRSGVLGALGAAVSMVTERAEDAAELLPAASVAVAVILWLPAAKVEAVILQLPEPSAVALPTEPSTLEVKVTVTLASEVPLKVGVLSDVSLSALELPVSLAASRSGVPGAFGAVESMVTARALEADEVFPAASVAVAVMLWAPAVSELPGVKLQLPEPSAVALPKLPSTLELTVTVALASAVPLKVGVVSLVKSSVLEVPKSLPASRSGVPGAEGALVSTVMASADEAEDVLPAASVAVAVML